MEEERVKKRMIAGVEPQPFAWKLLDSRLFLKIVKDLIASPPGHLPMLFLRVLLEQGYLKVFVRSQTQRSQKKPPECRPNPGPLPVLATF